MKRNTAEMVGGTGILSVGVGESILWILDWWGRWGIIMDIKSHLPLLFYNPLVIVPLCLVGGVLLVIRSVRSPTAHPVILDHRGTEIKKPVRRVLNYSFAGIAIGVLVVVLLVGGWKVFFSTVKAQDGAPSDPTDHKQQFTLDATMLKPDPTDKSPGAIHPGVRIVITAKETIEHLNFSAKCDVPCFFSHGDSPSSHFEWTPTIPIGDPRIATERILTPTELQKGQRLILYFRSRNDSPLSVLSINDQPVPGAKKQPPTPSPDSIWKAISSCPPGFGVGYLSDSVFDGGKGVGITTEKDTCLIVDGQSYVRGDSGAVCLGCGKNPKEAVKPPHQP